MGRLGQRLVLGALYGLFERVDEAWRARLEIIGGAHTAASSQARSRQSGASTDGARTWRGSTRAAIGSMLLRPPGRRSPVT